MTSWSSIVKKMGTFPDEMIHIMPKCAMHLHGHQNKMVFFIMFSIFADLSNGIKFRNYTYYSINDIQNHHFSHWINNHQIGHKEVVLSSYVKISS